MLLVQLAACEQAAASGINPVYLSREIRKAADWMAAAAERAAVYEFANLEKELLEITGEKELAQMILQAVKAVQEMERLGYSMPLEDLLHSQGIDLPATLEIVERINDGASRPQNDEKRKTSRRLEHPVTRGLPVYRFAQQGGAPLRVQRASRLPSLDSEIRHLAKLRKQLQDELRAA